MLEVQTRLSEHEIAKRVHEVNEYLRFAALTFSFHSEDHQANVLANADSIVVKSADGSVYFGHVEDWEEGREFYVNLD